MASDDSEVVKVLKAAISLSVTTAVTPPVVVAAFKVTTSAAEAPPETTKSTPLDNVTRLLPTIDVKSPIEPEISPILEIVTAPAPLSIAEATIFKTSAAVALARTTSTTAV